MMRIHGGGGENNVKLSITTNDIAVILPCSDEFSQALNGAEGTGKKEMCRRVIECLVNDILRINDCKGYKDFNSIQCNVLKDYAIADNLKAAML